MQARPQEAESALWVLLPGALQAASNQVLAHRLVGKEVAADVLALLAFDVQRQQAGLLAQQDQQAFGFRPSGGYSVFLQGAAERLLGGIAAGLAVPGQGFQRGQGGLLLLRKRAAPYRSSPGLLDPCPVEFTAGAHDLCGAGIVLRAQAQQERVIGQAAQRRLGAHVAEQAFGLFPSFLFRASSERFQPGGQVALRFLLVQRLEGVFLQIAQGGKAGRSGGDDQADLFPSQAGNLFSHLALKPAHFIQAVQQDQQAIAGQP